MNAPSPAARLSQQLAQNAEAVCRHYLSNGRRQGRYWLVGDADNHPGRSLYVRLKGPDSGKGAAGKWTDAATGEHGDLLDLIARNRHLDRLRDVLDEARAFLSLPQPDPSQWTPHRSPVPQGSPESARRLFAMSKPLHGSLAEAYLRGRAITHLIDLPALQFHPRCYYRARRRCRHSDLAGIDCRRHGSTRCDHRRPSHLARPVRQGQGSHRDATPCDGPSSRQCGALRHGAGHSRSRRRHRNDAVTARCAARPRDGGGPLRQPSCGDAVAHIASRSLSSCAMQIPPAMAQPRRSPSARGTKASRRACSRRFWTTSTTICAPSGSINCVAISANSSRPSMSHGFSIRPGRGDGLASSRIRAVCLLIARGTRTRPSQRAIRPEAE